MWWFILNVFGPILGAVSLFWLMVFLVFSVAYPQMRPRSDGRPFKVGMTVGHSIARHRDHTYVKCPFCDGHKCTGPHKYFEFYRWEHYNNNEQVCITCGAVHHWDEQLAYPPVAK